MRFALTLVAATGFAAILAVPASAQTGQRSDGLRTNVQAEHTDISAQRRHYRQGYRQGYRGGYRNYGYRGYRPYAGPRYGYYRPYNYGYGYGYGPGVSLGFGGGPRLGVWF
jgi:hypothetical protein